MTLARAPETLECPLPTRRGLNRVQAAGYVGVGSSKFDQTVSDGRMPQPVKIDGRRLWDVRALDRAFDELGGGIQSETNPWDKDNEDAA
ncbi:MAG: hypothetical protein AAFU80_07610 [Pseudomonadota bacterium]